MFHDRSLIRSSAGRVQYPCVKSAPDGTSHVTERCSPFIDKTPHRIRGSMWMGWERVVQGASSHRFPWPFKVFFWRTEWTAHGVKCSPATPDRDIFRHG